MVTLRQDTKGNFSARKRLPDDVRDDYGRRYGARFEAKFSAPSTVGAHAAKQMFRDWETEVAGRIAAIRAERTGWCIVRGDVPSGAAMWKWPRVLVVAVAALGVAACSSITMQGYADNQLPARPIQHIAAYVAAPTPLATSMQAGIAEHARRHAVLAEDALTILPPTRHYTNAEVPKALAERGVAGVLLITVADSGVVSQYAGTILEAPYSA
jgi:hypothetical protein